MRNLSMSRVEVPARQAPEAAPSMKQKRVLN
jgi:hypothetical protein